MTKVDYLIAGQGLAGTVFAWQALHRGRSVLLADPSPAQNASQAAAGIVHPFLGPKLNLSWRFHALWNSALPFYRRLERDLGLPFLHDAPLLRFYSSPAQKELWLTKRHLPDFAPLWTTPPDHPHDAFLCPRAAWLDTPAFLRASAARLPLLHEPIHPGDLTLRPNSVTWHEVHARRLVFCEGHAARLNPLFSFLPLRGARGDILDLHLPGFAESRILHRGKWLLPLGNHHFRAGSTFVWQGLPDPAASTEEILQPLRSLLPSPLPSPPYPIRSGIRPLLRQGRPVLGTHPRHPALALLNGLGAKGVLLAPFFALHLLDHLESGTPLDPEVDLLQHWKP